MGTRKKKKTFSIDKALIFFYDHSNLEEEGEGGGGGGGGGKTHVGMSLQLTRYKKAQYDKHLHPQ
jgi:hypothetical protein